MSLVVLRRLAVFLGVVWPECGQRLVVDCDTATHAWMAQQATSPHAGWLWPGWRVPLMHIVMRSAGQRHGAKTPGNPCEARSAERCLTVYGNGWYRGRML